MKRTWPFALKPDFDGVISIASSSESSDHECPECISIAANESTELDILEAEPDQEYSPSPTTPGVNQSGDLPCNRAGPSLDRVSTGSFDQCLANMRCDCSQSPITPVLNGDGDGRVHGVYGKDMKDTDDFADFGFMKSGVMSFRDLCDDGTGDTFDIASDITGTIETSKVHAGSGVDTVHRMRYFYDLPPFRFLGPRNGEQGDGDAAGGPPSLPTTPPSITSGEVDPQDFEDLPGPPIPTPDSEYYELEDGDGLASDSRDSMDGSMHEGHDGHLPIVLPPPDIGGADWGGRPPHGLSTSGECRTCICMRRCPTCGRELRLPRVVRFG